MNTARIILPAMALSLISLVHAQNTLPNPDTSAKMPPSPEGIAPANPGMVATPPATGTESETIRVPSKQMDPAITKPTDRIDQQNRKKFRDKQESKQPE